MARIFFLFCTLVFIACNSSDHPSEEVVNKPEVVLGDTLLHGKALFKQMCAPCHGINKPLAGPPLAGVRSRVPDTASMYAFTKNPMKVIASGNPYYVKLFEQYNKVPMLSYPNLSNADIDAILNYADWAAKQTVKTP